MPIFEKVRDITSYNRPKGTHGCKLTEIVPGLWTAHFEDINQPNSFSSLPIIQPVIGLVINAAVPYNQCPTFSGFYGPDIEVLMIELFDDPKEGEAHTDPSDARLHFDLVNNSIDQTIKEGKSALVHCYASISRSAVFLIAYLMKTKKMTVVEATQFVKAKWDATWPNDSFVFQLIEYQKEING